MLTPIHNAEDFSLYLSGLSTSDLLQEAQHWKARWRQINNRSNKADVRDGKVDVTKTMGSSSKSLTDFEKERKQLVELGEYLRAFIKPLKAMNQLGYRHFADNFTLLTYAARIGNVPLMKDILAAGAKIDQLDDSGLTALRMVDSNWRNSYRKNDDDNIASAQMAYEGMKCLLEAGAHVDAIQRDVSLIQDCTSFRPRPVSNPWPIRIIDLLIEHGADLHLKKAGKTLMQTAAFSCNLPALQYFAQKGMSLEDGHEDPSQNLVNLLESSWENSLDIAQAKEWLAGTRSALREKEVLGQVTASLLKNSENREGLKSSESQDHSQHSKKIKRHVL